MATVGGLQAPSVGTDHRGLTVLTLAECLRRLREVPLGRLGFRSSGDVLILPVNHVVDGATIAFRTDWGTKLEALSDGAPVSFEADAYDPESCTGWSVLAQGIVEWVDDDAECRRLNGLAPAGWLPNTLDAVWVRIRPEQVTGRQLTPAEPAGEHPDCEVLIAR